MKKLLVILIAMLFGSLSSKATVTTNPITPNAVCVGNTVTVSFSGVGGSGATLQISPDNQNCTWEIVKTFTVSASSGTVTFVVPATYTATGSCNGSQFGSTSGKTMWVQVFQSSGCLPVGGQPVTVYTSTVSMPTITATANSVCAGSSVTLTSSSAYGYLWNPGGATTSSIVVSPTATSTYSLSVSSPCATSPTQTKVITVTSMPVANISPASDQSICFGDAVSLSASGGATYVWSNGVSAQSINVTPTSTTSYYAVVSNACGSSNTGTVTVTVNQKPSPAIIVSPSATICAGDSVTLFDTNGSVSYLWNTGWTGAMIDVKPTVPTTYSLTETNASGCSATVSQTIQVNPMATANAGADQTIQSGHSTTLTASGNGSYSWSTGATTLQVVVAPSVTTTYTLIVTNQCGSAKDSVTIVVTSPATGIFENVNNSVGKILLFPNPASTEVSVSLADDLLGKSIEVSVYDMQGNKVLSQKSLYDGNVKLDVSNLNAGNYMTMVSSGGFYSSSKLVVIR